MSPIVNNFVMKGFSIGLLLLSHLAIAEEKTLTVAVMEGYLDKDCTQIIQDKGKDVLGYFQINTCFKIDAGSYSEMHCGSGELKASEYTDASCKTIKKEGTNVILGACNDKIKWTKCQKMTCTGALKAGEKMTEEYMKNFECKCGPDQCATTNSKASSTTGNTTGAPAAEGQASSTNVPRSFSMLLFSSLALAMKK